MLKNALSDDMYNGLKDQRRNSSLGYQSEALKVVMGEQ